VAALFSCPLLGRGGLTPLDHFTAPGGDSVKGRRPFMLTPPAGGINDQMTLTLSTTGAIHDPRCPPPSFSLDRCRKSLERLSEIIGTCVGNCWNEC